MKRYLLLIPVWAVTFTLYAQSIIWISACSNQTFCFNPNICSEGSVLLTEKAVTTCQNQTLTYLYRIDLFNNGGIDIQMANDTFQATLPAGVHKITWRASDFCGNVNSCTYLITVRDCQPPNLLCINGLTQTVDPPDCTVSFDADLFLLQLNDNCTPVDDIDIGFRRAGDTTGGFPTTTTLFFDKCDVGFNPLEILVRDGNGLINSCNTYVIVQQSTGCSCITDADVSLHGCARSAGNTALQTVRLKTNLVSTGGVTTPVTRNVLQAFNDSCFTSTVGQLPLGGSYLATVRSERIDNAVNGVSTFDLVSMSKHILNIVPLTSMYQLLAADVNLSKSVTTFDIAETRKIILGISDTFTFVPSWRMIRPFADPSQLNQFNSVVDTYRVVINNLQQDVSYSGFNFVGVKMGDVNLSASFAEPADDRYGEPLGVIMEETADGTGLNVRWAQWCFLSGWQLALQLDAAAVTVYDVEGVDPANWSYDAATGILRVVYFDALPHAFDKDDLLFGVRLKKTLSADEPALATAVMRPEAYNAEGKHRPLELRQPVPGKQDAGSTEWYPARPNPFHAQTSVGLNLPQEQSVTFELFDLNGKLLWTESRSNAVGLQTFTIDGVQLPVPGMYLYRLHVGDGTVFSDKIVHW